ncbi:ubiquitin-fold modifier-conjugating enzyme 1 [Populus alba x Populus x berolinensis]|uniref:Ubiquitin-fold modifier-conjugating enzyme 1 n=1 Tax=Populus alba x Populus x berolinensis TaxID=444605 RepID=A0AAD6REK1_9ROSI|nr:ubiquitin-fold modifier-conjugating enzyme 1 [Populus alba x Populus x berolinensis]
MEGWDPNTKSTLTQIPLLTTKAGPRDGAAWTTRLKEEYKALIAYTQMNKSNDNDWFRISAANPEGTRWTGKCWYVHNLLKYEFDLQFDIPVTYPSTAPELELPQLDGKTQKMYRGGKICLTVHFKPLWAKNWFGIAHALCLGLAPWLAAEVPVLVDSGMIKHKDDATSTNYGKQNIHEGRIPGISEGQSLRPHSLAHLTPFLEFRTTVGVHREVGDLPTKT